MGGWGIVVADVIVMANLGQISGQYGFELFGLDGLANSTWFRTPDIAREAATTGS